MDSGIYGKNEGIFRAEIADTSKFISDGTVGVYIDGIFTSDMDDTSQLGKQCIILTPYGGLDKMGLTFCPPIGAVGYIMYPGGNMNDTPVWVGCAMVAADKNIKAQDKKLLAKDMTDSTDIVLRTQYVQKNNQTLNSSVNKVENIIKMDQDAITVGHIRQDDYSNYTYDGGDIVGQSVNRLKIGSDFIELVVKQKGNSKSTIFKIDETSISFSFDGHQANSFIKILENSIELNAGDKSVIKLNDQGVITLDASVEIDLNGSDDNVTKWSGFYDFVDCYNSHVHGTPDGTSSSPNTSWNQAQSAKDTTVKCS